MFVVIAAVGTSVDYLVMVAMTLHWLVAASRHTVLSAVAAANKLVEMSAEASTCACSTQEVLTL
jgi:hypothetical protein